MLETAIATITQGLILAAIGGGVYYWRKRRRPE